MVDNLFSHDLRILTCMQCGAPLEAAVGGGLFTCSFCGTANQLARRDERVDLQAAQEARGTAVSEAERHARLREQDGRPPQLPPEVAALMKDGVVPPENVERAQTLWNTLRSQVGVGAPFATSERLFHLTLALTPQLDPRQRRALLETAIEILGDSGHRHVLRCTIARGAALAGDSQAAEAWLAPTRSRSTDLAMDTAYRYAAATMASIRQDWPRVTELLGWSAADVPLADIDEVGCALLRANVLERNGRAHEAVAELEAVLGKHGKAALRRDVRAFAPLAPATQSVQRVLSEHDEREREELSALIEEQRVALSWEEAPWWNLGTILLSLVIAVPFAMFLSIPWACVISPETNIDPWLGPHSKVFCPMVCDGCTGPYIHVRYKRNDSGEHDVYCRDPSLAPEQATRNWFFFNGDDAGEPYELPGGGFTLWLTSFPIFIPLGVFIFYGNRIRTRRRREKKAVEIRAKLAEAERALAAVGR